MSIKDIKKEEPIPFIWPVYVGAPVEGMKNSPISYHVMEDGIYCRKNIFGDKYIYFKTEKVDGLPKGKAEVSPLAEAKIPNYLLLKTVEFFKFVIKHFSSSLEAFVVYGYNRKLDKYFLYVPKQTITAAHVTYDIEDFHEKNPDSYIVGDAHSHNNMDAFWSGTDNSDDSKRNRYSVVIGKIGKLYPNIKCRFSYETKHVDMELDALFEDNDKYLEPEDFAEAVKKIEEPKAVIYVGGHVGSAVGYYANGGYGQNKSGYTPPGASKGQYSTYFNNRTAGNDSTAVAKCTRCGKFSQTKKMYIDKEDMLCEACNTATDTYLTAHQQHIADLEDAYGDWGVYG